MAKIFVSINSVAIYGETCEVSEHVFEAVTTRVRGALTRAFPNDEIEVVDWSSCRYLRDGKHDQKVAQIAIASIHQA